MRVEHFLGKIETEDVQQVMKELESRTEDGFNEFWISDASNYPCICASYNNMLAHIHYFEKEDDCGMQIVSNDNRGGTTEFYTNAPNESFYIDNRYVVESKKADEIIAAFCSGADIKERYDFEEL